MQKISLVLFIAIGLVATRVQGQITLPARMYGDSLHAPFYHGVASGDPLPDAVIIWTRITPDSADFSPLTVNFDFAVDSLFGSILTSGTVVTDSASDWTVKLDVSGLNPNTVYYYRFDDGAGHYSSKGRTKTAPQGVVTDLKFAVFSCSSIFSGFFNGYARVAEKADSLNAAIHLGDYIYDFVDLDEQVRIPSPFPIEPHTLEEWRDRHAYYLLDPDLRAAKARLPWISLWDNHDQDCGGSYACAYQGGNEAFMEWLPIRIVDTTHQLNIYRSFHFGNLADIFVADALMFRHTDTLSNGEYNILGNTQFAWLTQALLNSTAKWKLLPQQRMMGGWYTNGVAQWVLDILPNDGPVFDAGSWDGFPQSKAQLFNFLRTNNINNTMVLSGDAHVSIAQDLVEDPFNSSVYNVATGVGSVGVEFLPTSVSRGNMDEAGAPIGLFTTINNIDRQANPQHQFADLFNHGYGIIHLKPDSSIAQFWYTPILQVSTQDSLGATLVVKDGENHWSRNSGFSGVKEDASTAFQLFPNPATDLITLQFTHVFATTVKIEILDLYGKVLISQEINTNTHGNQHIIPVHGLAAGLYFIRLNNQATKKLIKY
jgi:alkaline phosphatase D